MRRTSRPPDACPIKLPSSPRAEDSARYGVCGVPRGFRTRVRSRFHRLHALRTARGTECAAYPAASGRVSDHASVVSTRCGQREVRSVRRTSRLPDACPITLPSAPRAEDSARYGVCGVPRGLRTRVRSRFCRLHALRTARGTQAHTPGTARGTGRRERSLRITRLPQFSPENWSSYSSSKRSLWRASSWASLRNSSWMPGESAASASPMYMAKAAFSSFIATIRACL